MVFRTLWTRSDKLRRSSVNIPSGMKLIPGAGESRHVSAFSGAGTELPIRLILSNT